MKARRIDARDSCDDDAGDDTVGVVARAIPTGGVRDDVASGSRASMIHRFTSQLSMRHHRV